MDDLFVGGVWRGPAAGGTREIRCPADGTHVATVSEATAEDAVAAVLAAREAFEAGAWRDTPESDRGDLLLRVADLLERDRKDVARAESLDTGKRLVESEYDVDDVIACFRYYGGIAGTDAGRVVDTGRPDAISRIVTEPIGVCGLITPWNYPLLQPWKVAPALLAGNTFVLKPSELTPSTAILLTRLLEEAGLPPGTANLVLGEGAQVGAVLAEHPAVDMVSFTGGLATGRRVMAAAAGTVKRVALELGGKRPNVVFADADMDRRRLPLAAVFVPPARRSAGARRSWGRRADEFVTKRRPSPPDSAGGPFDPEAETGPLISSAPGEDRGPVAAGVAEGGAARRARPRRSTELQLHLPTVLDECGPDAVLTRVLRSGTDGGTVQRRR